MITCPNCGQQLSQDPAQPERMVCAGCGYSLDGGSEDYWGTRGLNPKKPAEAAAVAQPAEVVPTAAQPKAQASADPAAASGVGEAGSTASMPPSGAYAAPAAQPSVGYASGYGDKWTDPDAPQAPKGFAITALVLGILAILGFWVPVANVMAIVMAIIAIILGILAVNRASKGIGGGKGMAIAGIATGATALVLAIVVNVMFGVVMGELLDDPGVRREIDAATDEYDRYDDDYDRYYDDDDDYDDDYYGHHGTTGPLYGEDATWASFDFTMDGKPYKVMETKLGDFCSQSGWLLDDVNGYDLTYTVSPQAEVSVILLYNPSNVSDDLWVNAYNGTDEPLALGQCVISCIDCDVYSGSFDFVTCGVGIGSTLDEVIAAVGTPVEDYVGTSGYRTVSYQTRNYSKALTFTASDGSVVDEVELSTY